ncbi:hypothetical protein GCM10009636_09050 [Arthrobacter koreensis]|jgi:hypothetical protein|uniref:DUF2530 domain-containing protein n=1 Tax=Arthrobacter koreensis TaxID=199136 RepID=A0ABY6FQK0_9MICC|nr:hypothetical protein [Arthrobacter koreensis]MDF2497947.1 hypothetical protein [Arthrobacter koreensis]MEB7446385.1 hypothetical protein [Arthrobacter koreensis]UYB35442.1 hypothetical protein N9A08_12505 [Arthrobacter koreensis]
MSESTNQPRSYDSDPAVFGAASDAGYVQENEPERRPLRVGTIVWGLVLAVAGALILAVQLTGIRLDTGVVLLGLLIGAGAALVIGGLLAVLGKNRAA